MGIEDRQTALSNELYSFFIHVCTDAHGVSAERVLTACAGATGRALLLKHVPLSSLELVPEGAMVAIDEVSEELHQVLGKLIEGASLLGISTGGEEEWAGEPAAKELVEEGVPQFNRIFTKTIGQIFDKHATDPTARVNVLLSLVLLLLQQVGGVIPGGEAKKIVMWSIMRGAKTA